jgi:hypothetical protein
LLRPTPKGSAAAWAGAWAAVLEEAWVGAWVAVSVEASAAGWAERLGLALASG